MSSAKLPQYREAVRQPRSLQVLQVLGQKGGQSSFSELGRESGISDSILYHHLSRLQRLNVVASDVKGTYRLAYKTPLCFIFGDPKHQRFVYFGLLGRRNSHKQSETKVALELLMSQGIKPELAYVLTSFEALKDWEDQRLPYQWILCYDDQIVDIDSVKGKVRKQLEGLLERFSVILDCTSATKPATIAYYQLAQEYEIPLMYVYEDKMEMKWLISRESLMKGYGVS